MPGSRLRKRYRQRPPMTRRLPSVRENVISHPLGHNSALAIEAPAYSSLRSFSGMDRCSLGMSLTSMENVHVTDPSACLIGVNTGGVKSPAIADPEQIRQSSSYVRMGNP